MKKPRVAGLPWRGVIGGTGSGGEAVPLGVIWLALSIVFATVVIGYWLRKIARALAITAAVQETAANRAALSRGESPITDDIDVDSVMP